MTPQTPGIWVEGGIIESRYVEVERYMSSR